MDELEKMANASKLGADLFGGVTEAVEGKSAGFTKGFLAGINMMMMIGNRLAQMPDEEREGFMAGMGYVAKFTEKVAKDGTTESGVTAC